MFGNRSCSGKEVDIQRREETHNIVNQDSGLALALERIFDTICSFVIMSSVT